MRRSGRVVTAAGAGFALQRFEKPAPNLVWQIDFEGWFGLSDGMRCHPLTMRDDHSRYLRVWRPVPMNKQRHLTATFRRYGLPDAMFVDNGSPRLSLGAGCGVTAADSAGPGLAYGC